MSSQITTIAHAIRFLSETGGCVKMDRSSNGQTLFIEVECFANSGFKNVTAISAHQSPGGKGPSAVEAVIIAKVDQFRKLLEQSE
jgi:hypothetical protein